MDAFVLKRILQNLHTELQLQTKLLELLTTERSEIVHLKAEELDKIRYKKEDVLLKISDNKDNRDKIIEPLKQTLQAGEKLHLGKFFDQAAADLKTSFKKVSAELKKIAEAANKLNAENGSLLKQSLGLVSSTISILTAKPTTQNNNYSREGKVASQDDEMPISKLGSVSSFNRSV